MLRKKTLTKTETKKLLTKVLKEQKEDMKKMKKNILKLSIVFVTVLVFSTMTMAGGKKHYHPKWWNPLSGLWSAIYQLQDRMNNLNKQIDQKLAALSSAGGTTTTPLPSDDIGAVPIVCPGCWFPEGKIFKQLDFDTTNLLKGAFLPGVQMSGIDLSGADLTNIDLRGSLLSDVNFTDATLIGADFSPRPMKANGISGENQTVIINANMLGADLTDAKGLDTVLWTNTICPDGSKSQSNGNTCKDNL